MKIRLIFLLILLFAAALGYRLRSSNFASVPLPGQSTDEYSNAWVGLSFLRLGTPVGISGLVGIKTYPTYINPDRIYSQTIPGGALPISYPWFDHPPLLGIISGTAAYLSGARVFEDVSTVMIRRPLIVLSTITVMLVGWLGYLWLGPLAGSFAAVLYATSPLIIVGGRMVQAENGLVPMWLISLILLTLAERQNKPNLVRLAAGFAGLAVLFKLSGVAAIISGVFLITDRRRLIEFLAVAVSIAALFIFFGLAIDGREFLAVLSANANRTYGIGLNALNDLVTSTKVTSTKYLADGWPLFGWLTLAYLTGSKSAKKGGVILICLLSYLAVYLLFGSASYGWYRIPFMPFLFLAAGWFLTEMISSANPLLSAFLLIPLGVTLMKLFDVNTADWLVKLFRFGSFGLLIMILASQARSNDKILQQAVHLMAGILLFIIIIGNIYFNLNLDAAMWYKVD